MLSKLLWAGADPVSILSLVVTLLLDVLFVSLLRAVAAAEEAKRLAELKQKELDAITKAAQEARAEAQEASKEAKRQAFERTKSRKARQVEATDRDRRAQ